jgi:CO/xanthine dehydrogenase FAD-binding subunit
LKAAWPLIEFWRKAMIIEYNRPDTLEQALALLARKEPFSVPLAGGTGLRRINRPLAVVDLQLLGLDGLQRQGNSLHLGATLRLQRLLEELEAGELALEGLKESLAQAICREAAYNQRQAATIAGSLMNASGRSPFATALLALDTKVFWMPGDESIALGDWLPLRAERRNGRLITGVTIPANARLAYEAVARTPADRPIVCVAAAAWPSGRTRIALGGFGQAPTLAFDGTEANGGETAARSAYSEAGDDWASAEYRAAMAAILAGRCLQAVQEQETE